MDSSKIKKFMQLAGQETRQKLTSGDPAQRALGAQLLLSEVLEYVIKGLGVIPYVKDTPITEPDALRYEAAKSADHEEMIDGLADVAYTMYWNSCAFGVPLEEAFELVCDNNLEKFVSYKTTTESLVPWSNLSGTATKTSLGLRKSRALMFSKLMVIFLQLARMRVERYASLRRIGRLT